MLPRPNHLATDVAAPTKFAEYAAMGKPILTTDVGDAAELVAKYKCGIVVDSNDSEGLKNGVLELKKKSKDDLLNMGKNSRKLAEQEFSFKKMRDDLNSILKN